ncbi:transglutaminase-like domain-containing protein [Vannielia litorea]|uniref:transglutaminase-like domain-containing protein n=1 Tax=Vannielia litorea TaxID=1217970 RepID=UPI001BD0CBF9|nr:transglutaminase family protein [Vannielia litorea]MBS8229245.1 transglutaminase family protein [Vannielia litorea]
MLIRFGFEIEVECASEVPMLLSLSTHPDAAGRLIGEDRVRAEPACALSVYHDRFSNRITRVVAPEGKTKFWSDGVMEQDGQADRQSPEAVQHQIADLPDEVLSYLLPSRYCDSDSLITEAWETFGTGPAGWPLVQAITGFVHRHVTFGYQFGRADKTASQVWREKTGVCRDFAHLAIALCRAMNIPARYASGYLGDIGVPYSGPGDFCAWFEVYLGGRWHTFDARYNVPRVGRILMVRGCDASDCAMITSFGAHELKYFRVWTDQLDDGMEEADVMELLARRPAGEPLVFPSSARVA